MKKMIPAIGLAFVAAVGFVVWCCVYVGAKSDYHLRPDREDGLKARHGSPEDVDLEDEDFDVASLLDEELDLDYCSEEAFGKTDSKAEAESMASKTLEEVL